MKTKFKVHWLTNNKASSNNPLKPNKEKIKRIFETKRYDFF